MKAKIYSATLASLMFLLAASTAKSQVSGTVFRDINSDGVKQSSNPTEPWEFGIRVKAFNAANNLVGTTYTDANGNYTIPATAGMALRVEFYTASGDQPAKRHSNIQFVIAGPSATANFAVASKKSQSANANPFVATSAYSNGNPLSSGAGSAGDRDNILVFPYDLSTDGGSTRRAANKHLGSVFGLAWQRESRTLMLSAYMKRHAGFGPGGIGAIYETQIGLDGVPSEPKMLLDVNALGINVGTDPRTEALPDMANMPNTDIGVFSQIGKRGIGGIDLTIDGRELYIVNMYENKLHRIDVGNPLKPSYTAADVSGTWALPDPKVTGTSFHPMACEIHENKVFIGGVTTQETTNAHSQADTFGLKGIVYAFDIATETFSEVLRFPLTYRRGFSNADFRYADRNNYWSAWQNNGDISLFGPLRSGLQGLLLGGNATGIYYSQPMLSSIDFDADGAMILGVRDRFGDQAGHANYFETGNGLGETYRALTSGEMLRAGRNGNNFEIEDGGAVTNNGVVTATPGATDNNPISLGDFLSMLVGTTPWGGSYGPGGKYYYYNQNFSNTNVPAPFNGGNSKGHYVKSNGGLAVFPGYNEVMMTSIDPETASFANGVIKNFNYGSNAGNMSGRKQLFVASSTDPSSMGKAAAMGDLEILFDAESMEIGNQIWNDGNGNGRQDAGEAGIDGVEVTLHSPGADNIYGNTDDEKWVTTSDADGHYYFDESIVNDSRRPESWIGVSNTHSGILPGFEYTVEIDKAQSSLGGLNLVGTHYHSNEIDNDGRLMPSGLVTAIVNPGGSTAAGSQFNNDYNVDFGFGTHVLAANQVELSANLFNTTVTLNWNTVDENNVSKYYVERSTDGKNFSTVGYAYSKGNGSFGYTSTDDVSKLNATSIMYRLRIEEKNNAVRYSNSVRVGLTQKTSFFAGPNPFFEVLNVQVSSATNEIASVRVINLAGQIVYAKSVKLQKGTNNFTLNDFKQLSQGMYVVTIEAGQQIQQQKLIKR